ncbi:MAG: hypothetical protein AAF386_04140, partial [Pseudomonadota bacterium]
LSQKRIGQERKQPRRLFDVEVLDLTLAIFSCVNEVIMVCIAVLLQGVVTVHLSYMSSGLWDRIIMVVLYIQMLFPIWAFTLYRIKSRTEHVLAV